MINQDTNSKVQNYRFKWLFKISGCAAFLAGILFLIAVKSLLSSSLQLDKITSVLSPVANNWLIVIFKLHAGFSGVDIEQLHALNFLDLTILVFIAVMALGLYAALRRTRRIWSLIAAIQPLLGIVLFIATKNAGRSAVMGSVLVISAVMLRSNIFNRATASVGILASALLLAGDLTAGIIPPSAIIADLFGMGYVLLITWLFLIGQKLFQLGQNTEGFLK